MVEVLGHFERKALQNYAEKPHLWLRYIDNIFMVWTHGQEKSLRCRIAVYQNIMI